MRIDPPRLGPLDCHECRASGMIGEVPCETCNGTGETIVIDEWEFDEPRDDR